jgi:ParB/RepB/Spo0J family partition protein
MPPQNSVEVALKDIVVGDNPRSDLPEIEKIAASIKKVGVLQPVVVQHEADGKLHLVAGFRRYFGAKKAGLTTIPVVLRSDSPTPAKKLQLALIENIQREDMNAMDRALAIQSLVESEGSQKEAAEALGVSEGYISQHLGYLKMPRQAQQYLATGRIDASHARQLVRVKEEDTLLELLEAAPAMTAVELGNKVDALLHEEKHTKRIAAKEKPAESEEPEEKPKRKKAPANEDVLPQEDEKPSLADIYMEAELDPKTEKDLRELLMSYAIKLDKAESHEKKVELKNVLKGIELAAGVKVRKK